MAIILLYIDTGLRVSEVAGLRVEDIDLHTRQFMIRSKGSKVRTVGFGNSAGLALARYLKLRTNRNGAGLPALWQASRSPVYARLRPRFSPRPSHPQPRQQLGSRHCTLPCSISRHKARIGLQTVVLKVTRHQSHQQDRMFSFSLQVEGGCASG